MQALTPRCVFSKLFAPNSTANGAITAPIPRTTAPSGDGIFNCGKDGDVGQINFADLRFFGAGANNATGSFLLVGWRNAIDVPGGTKTPIYIPKKLLAFDVTLGTSTGVAGAVVVDTDRFADTIAVTTAYASSGSYDVESPADDSIASIKIDVIGLDFLQLLPNRGGSATNLNALAAGF